MKKVNFSVRQRNNLGTGHARRLRKQRKLSGVVYGMGKNVVHIETDLVPLEKLYYTAGESTIISLDIDGKEKEDVLIHTVEFDPLKNEIIHIDFLRVDQNRKIHTAIPIHFIGNSEGARLGGVLVYNKSELEIECLVKDLIHDIEVDLSVLDKIGSRILLSDIKLPEGIHSMLPETIIIAHIEVPRSLEEEDAAAAAAAAAAAEAAAAAAPAEGETGEAGEAGKAVEAPTKETKKEAPKKEAPKK